jgi:hypothetical protein
MLPMLTVNYNIICILDLYITVDKIVVNIIIKKMRFYSKTMVILDNILNIIFIYYNELDLK